MKYENTSGYVWALLFTRENIREVRKLLGTDDAVFTVPRCPKGVATLTANTELGEMIIKEGDYVVRSSIGEMYSLDPYTFGRNYKLVEDEKC